MLASTIGKRQSLPICIVIHVQQKDTSSSMACVCALQRLIPHLLSQVLLHRIVSASVQIRRVDSVVWNNNNWWVQLIKDCVLIYRAVGAEMLFLCWCWHFLLRMISTTCMRDWMCLFLLCTTPVSVQYVLVFSRELKYRVSCTKIPNGTNNTQVKLRMLVTNCLSVSHYCFLNWVIYVGRINMIRFNQNKTRYYSEVLSRQEYVIAE